MLEWTSPDEVPRGPGTAGPLFDAMCSSLETPTGRNAQLSNVELDIGSLLDASERFPHAVADRSPDQVGGVLKQFTDAIGTSDLPDGDGFAVFRPDGSDQPPPSDKPEVPRLLGFVVPRSVVHDDASVTKSRETIIDRLRETDFFAEDDLPDAEALGATRAAMGIVDISIAFLNRRFMRKCGKKTRFEMLWIQGRTMKPARPSDVPPTASLLKTGTFLLRQDIDRLIERHTHDGVLDEAAAYAEFSGPPAGYRDPWVLRAGHGTAILDHMAGAEPGELDHTRPIYGVELPSPVLAEPSGARLLPSVLSGLTAIALVSFLIPVSRSDDTNDPLIMNASLSFTGGPDARENLLADALADLMKSFKGHALAGGKRQIRLTVPVGNHLQDRLHATFAKGGRGKIDWVVPPDDRTPSVVEICRDGVGPLALTELQVSTPGRTGPLLQQADLPGAGQYIDLKCNGETIGRLARSIPGQGPDHLVLKVRPTYSPDGDQPVSPSGIWVIEARSEDAPVQMWIRRDDTLDGFVPAGRQSRFSDPFYCRFDDLGDHLRDDPQEGHSLVRRDGTLSVLGYAAEPDTGILLVAGEEQSQVDGSTAYRFGGFSDARPPTSRAPAEESRVKRGPMAAGRQSGTVARPPGTSIASALFARQVAEELRPTGVSGTRGHTEY